MWLLFQKVKKLEVKGLMALDRYNKYHKSFSGNQLFSIEKLDAYPFELWFCLKLFKVLHKIIRILLTKYYPLISLQRSYLQLPFNTYDLGSCFLVALNLKQKILNYNFYIGITENNYLYGTSLN